jgi:hypothetical protein
MALFFSQCSKFICGKMAMSARWHLLESLEANPEFFGGAIGFGIGHSSRGLIPKLPAKAAPPKDLGFFVAC